AQREGQRHQLGLVAELGQKDDADAQRDGGGHGRCSLPCCSLPCSGSKSARAFEITSSKPLRPALRTRKTNAHSNFGRPPWRVRLPLRNFGAITANLARRHEKGPLPRRKRKGAGDFAVTAGPCG